MKWYLENAPLGAWHTQQVLRKQMTMTVIPPPLIYRLVSFEYLCAHTAQGIRVHSPVTRNSWWPGGEMGLALQEDTTVFTGTGVGQAKLHPGTQGA